MTTASLCVVDGCGRPVRYTSTGMCPRHYHRTWRGAPLELPTCSVEGCLRQLMANNDTGRCVPHRYVLKTWGVCGAEDCDKRIRSDNTSGLCGPHLRVLKALDWHNARRARVAQLWVEDIERMRVLDDHNGVCHLCGNEVGADWHMDHVIPIAMQGPHSYGNVAPAHPACNLRKQAYRPGSPTATVDAAARAAYLSFHGKPFTP